MASYLEQLQAADPQGYQKLLSLMSYTANENFGGTPQAYQAEIFAGLDPLSIANTPKTIDFNSATMADPYNRVIGNTEDNWGQVIGYNKPITTSSGTQIYANYDAQGNLTGYSGNPRQRSFTNGSTSYSGRWDTSGRANPQQYTSSGGGFLSGLAGDIGSVVSDLAPMALKAAALYYGGQALGGALGGGEAALAGGESAIGTGAGAGGYEAGAGGTNLFADQAIPGNAADLAGYGTAATAGGAYEAGAGGTNLFADQAIPGNAADLAGYGTGAAAATGLGSTVGNVLQNVGTRLGINAGLNTLFGGSTGTRNMATDNSTFNFGNLAGGLLSGLGNLAQGSTNTAAANAQAAQLRQAGQLAQQQAQFRPVGVTTNFGSSQFTVDPTTGQLTSAGYSLSPQLQAYQDAIMGANRQSLSDAAALQNLGRQYVAQSPQAAAQQWLQGQQNLLAPSRQQAWSNLANQDFNRGTTGLKVAQGGNLQSANPYATALANAQAQQDLALAAQAQQQGQAQTKFGQGLLSTAYQPFTAGLAASQGIEALGQQPLTLGTQLGQAASTAGARAGQLGLGANEAAAQAALRGAYYNPTAQVLQGLGGSNLFSSTAGNLLSNSGLGNWLGGLFTSGNPWDVANQGGGNADIGVALGGLSNTGDLGLVW